MKKFIFLDIDGVLAGDEEWGVMLEDKSCTFNREALNLLEWIMDEVPEAEIILSSTWRKGMQPDDIKALFKLRGFKHWERATDRTVVLFFKPVRDKSVESYMCTPRGCEIEEYIVSHTNRVDQYKYVILDDGSDMMYWQRHNFVHVRSGLLTKEDAQKVVEILK